MIFDLKQFVQCFANPLYLHELHLQKYLSQPELLNYLKYLEYWREPEYVRFIMYVFFLLPFLVVLTLVKDIRHVWFTSLSCKSKRFEIGLGIGLSLTN